MTELPGQPQWAANQRWMRQLGEVLIDVHAIDAAAASAVRPFAVYTQEWYALPKWATKPALWERAIEIFHGPVPDEDHTFIHRDFYPGNVLWQRRTVSGLVDWEAARVGPRSMDVAHCRINLLYQGLDAAEVFTREWEHRTGRTFNRWADIATIIGLLDSDRRNPPGPSPTVRHRSDAAMRHQRNRRHMTSAEHSLNDDENAHDQPNIRSPNRRSGSDSPRSR